MGAVQRLMSRRRLRARIVQGAAVGVALPFGCFPEYEGTALASGDPRRVRFGMVSAMHHRGTAMVADKQVRSPDDAPRRSGAGIDQAQDQYLLAPRRTDGRKTQRPQVTGGRAPGRERSPMADHHSAQRRHSDLGTRLAKNTRFRSLGASCTGNPAST